MDDLDKQIITQMQMDFPLEANPYDIIAERLGVSAEEVFGRVDALMDIGTIRRVGASIDSRKLGYSSTLAAVRVTDERVDEACELINSYPEITHSYLRKNEYNIWFTVIAVDRERVEGVIEELRARLGLNLDDVLDLPVLNLFKLDARFKPTK
jgi:DNA-binding Lrp family transcriptional regulator